MGQLKIVDEDELDTIITDAVWGEIYRDTLEKVQKKYYPNYISVGPAGDYQYHYEILMEMIWEIKKKRKPWWKRLFW